MKPSPLGLRLIKFSVIFMAVLILAGMITIVVTLINRASQWGEEEDTAVATVHETLVLGPGDRIASATLDGVRALLVVDRADGRQDVLVVDARSGVVTLSLTGAANPNDGSPPPTDP